jgi:hypothetical protein
MENPSEPPGLLRVCPSCNSRIEPDHTFCEICGAKMPELPACPSCGAQFIAPVKYCERCGTRVIPEETTVPAAVGRPEHGYQLVPPASRHSGVKEDALVPPSSGRNHPGHADDALFLVPEEPAPAKPKRIPTPLISGIVLLLILCAAAYFIGLPIITGSGLAGGLSKPAAAEIRPVAVSTTIPTLPPTLTETPVPLPGPLDPRPTQRIPTDQKFNFLVQKNRVDARISVIFTGSAGINGISSADVKVTRPGGTFTTGTILPLKGMNEITLDGSKEADRVEIIAKMPDGETYRVYDELVPFTER